MLTPAQMEYLKGASSVEVGQKYGIKGLEEIREEGFEKRALHLALKGQIRDAELLKGILIKSGISVVARKYFSRFLEKGLDRGVIYSAIVSCMDFEYLPQEIKGFEEFMTTRNVMGYRLKYTTSARRVFNGYILPEWEEFLPLIEEGVRLRLENAYKKRNILESIEKKWGRLGKTLKKKFIWQL